MGYNIGTIQKPQNTFKKITSLQERLHEYSNRRLTHKEFEMRNTPRMTRQLDTFLTRHDDAIPHGARKP